MNRILFGALTCAFLATASPIVEAQDELRIGSSVDTKLSPGQTLVLSHAAIEPNVTYAFAAGLLTSGLAEN